LEVSLLPENEKKSLESRIQSGFTRARLAHQD
jgi:hypothetical protein